MSVLSARKPGVADVLTLGNALCGIAAMLAAAGLGPFESVDLDERFRVAAMLLVASTFLDVVDGAAARRWGGTPLGPPLDCLADAISFGVAPAVAVLACSIPDASRGEQTLVMVAVLAYGAAALVRLADFAVHRQDDPDFVGLPTTAACMGVLALGFLSLPPVGIAIGLLGLAGLMVSPIVYPAGTSMVGVLIIGWVAGTLGITGIVDVRVCAVVTLLLLCLVVPVMTALRTGTAVRRSA